MIKVYGVAVFEVKRDLDVALLDLESIGVHRLDYVELDPDYFAYLDKAEEEFSKWIGVHKSSRDYVFELGGDRLILARFYMAKSNVEVALFISLRGGTLRLLNKRLERIGWRRRMIFEVRRATRSIKYTD